MQLEKSLEVNTDYLFLGMDLFSSFLGYEMGGACAMHGGGELCI
jgi:hypothetical protein